jgi:hypothetical protein
MRRTPNASRNSQPRRQTHIVEQDDAPNSEAVQGGTCARQTNLQSPRDAAECGLKMSLIKLNRINKGGEIVLNSQSILFIEVESRSTTIHMTHNLLFSAEETPDAIAEMVESIETARIKNAIQQSGLGAKQTGVSQ